MKSVGFQATPFFFFFLSLSRLSLFRPACYMRANLSTGYKGDARVVEGGGMKIAVKDGNK